MSGKVYTIIVFLLTVVINCFSQDKVVYTDSNPPPPPKPHLVIDSARNRSFKEYGLELLDIKTYHCNESNSKEKFLQTVLGDTLIISVKVAANCCRDFIGRINSNWGKNIEVELFKFGNNFCTCNCNYVFDFIILITKEDMWDVDRIVTIDNSEFTLEK